MIFSEAQVGILACLSHCLRGNKEIRSEVLRNFHFIIGQTTVLFCRWEGNCW